MLFGILRVEGAAELKESAFSSDGLFVALGRTADGKAKATVTPQGSPTAFFLRVKVKWRNWADPQFQIVGLPEVQFAYGSEVS